MKKFKNPKYSFESQGVRCAAALHLPDCTDSQPMPAILMVHGWGGTQLVLVKEFIKRFNEMGIAILTFDYPGWGHSEGLPRNVINPWSRLRTADSALALLKSLPEIDETRVLLWGSSFGGGHVVDLAAEHPELLGAIAQVPMLDGRDVVKAMSLKQMARFGIDTLRDLIHPFKTRYLPIVAEAGGYSSMQRDGAARVGTWVEENLDHNVDNRVAARSLLTVGLYQPYRRLSSIIIPTLLIGATQDTVAPFNERKVRRISSRSVEVRAIDANHFDPYFEPWFEGNINHQVEFVERLLARRP